MAENFDPIQDVFEVLNKHFDAQKKAESDFKRAGFAMNLKKLRKPDCRGETSNSYDENRFQPARIKTKNCDFCGYSPPSENQLVLISKGVQPKKDYLRICTECVTRTKQTLEDFCEMMNIPKMEDLTDEARQIIREIFDNDDCVGMWFERGECTLCTLEGKNVSLSVHEMEDHVLEHHRDTSAGGKCVKDCNLHFRTLEERADHERYCGAWCRECGTCFLKCDAHFRDVHHAYVCPGVGCVGTFRSLRTACKHVSWYHLWKVEKSGDGPAAALSRAKLFLSHQPEFASSFHVSSSVGCVGTSHSLRTV
ncbi:uncharacterized protein LOC135936193 [Cloeon dipterum]|uniref:uncharacterized protein LOC135936193 n=1 Tax=Cloeon dipterum TaxID=197152 RepID=UPI0032203E08